MTEAYVVRGDFRIIKLDGMFHVVFRPDADPEWFRIIASFFTYERAFQYWDVERVLSFEGDSDTSDELKAGVREPPVFEMPDPQGGSFSIRDMVRDVVESTSDAELPAPIDPSEQEMCEEQPHYEEAPDEYHSRLHRSAIAAMPAAVETTKAEIASAADSSSEEPPIDREDEQLTEREAAVLAALDGKSNYLGIVSVSLGEIAAASRVPLGSVSFLLEQLEKRRLLKKVERGTNGRSSIYRVESKAAGAQA